MPPGLPADAPRAEPRSARCTPAPPTATRCAMPDSSRGQLRTARGLARGAPDSAPIASTTRRSRRVARRPPAAHSLPARGHEWVASPEPGVCGWKPSDALGARECRPDPAPTNRRLLRVHRGSRATAVVSGVPGILRRPRLVALPIGPGRPPARARPDHVRWWNGLWCIMLLRGARARVDPCWWEVFGDTVGGEPDLPVTLVEQPVMTRAQQHGIVVAGGSAVAPSGSTWWASHQDAGRSQPGKVHPRSRRVMARRIVGGNNRTAVPMSSTWEAEPRTAGMIIASQASILAWAAVIGPPWSSTAVPSFPVSASRSMVTVTCGRSPPWVGANPTSRNRRSTSTRAWPRRTFAGRGSGVPSDGGSGCGEAVDGLGHEFHPEVVQEPLERGQPGRWCSGTPG